MARLRGLALGTAAAAGLAVAGQRAWAWAAPPTVPSFYDPPPLDPDVPPGTLLRTERTERRPEATIWRILYTSRDLDGAPVAISGTLAAPTGPAPAGGFPLLAIGHGTTGIVRGSAPSLHLHEGREEFASIYDNEFAPYLAEGFAVTCSDFQGLGAPGVPSYLVGTIEGRNVLDSVRAARAFPEVPVGDRVILRGHSQGGHAVAFAAQLHQEYAPELPLDGVIMIAPAAELEGLLDGFIASDEHSPLAVLGLLVADAWSQAYPEATLRDAVTPIGETLVKTVTSRANLMAAAVATALFRPSRLIDPAVGYHWAGLIRENSPGAAPIGVPVFIGQGDRDQIIAAEHTDRYAARLRESGIPVEYRRYADRDHFSIITASDHDVMNWIRGVLAGELVTQPA